MIPFLGLALSTSLQNQSCSSPPFSAAIYTIPLYPPLIPFTGVYSADITIGSQTLRAALDTGSSDTWFLTQNANCTAVETLQPVTPDQCGYSGPRYIPDATFETIPNRNFNDSYGTGERITGQLGYTKLVFGGLTVPKQEISAATYASVGGDPEGSVSGLLGLAYPNATAAYPGTDPSQDIICTGNSSCGPIPYSPFVTTIFNNNLTQPIFAFALSRSSVSGGVMTIGGSPPLEDPYVNASSGVVATVPIKTYPNTTELLFYYVEVDNFEYADAPPNAGQGRFLIDTGTSVSVLPQTQAEAINALFDPPAVFNNSIGYYTVLCNATAPSMGVNLGGQTFFHNPQDLIIPAVGDIERCWSAIQASLAVEFLPILGASFLKNVLAVFDVGQTQMTFMSRMYYQHL